MTGASFPSRAEAALRAIHSPPPLVQFHPMAENQARTGPFLLDERSSTPFRSVFRRILAESRQLDTAILRIRLSGVDLSPEELEGLDRLRILVADLNAQTLEEEAFALLMDPGKRETLDGIQGLLSMGLLELRAAPLAGWSPDFSVFSDPGGPRALLLGLHWIQRPFPHRGPAWLAAFGPEEARRGHDRFEELWRVGHDIGPAVLKLLTRTTRRWRRPSSTARRGPEGLADPGTPLIPRKEGQGGRATDPRGEPSEEERTAPRLFSHAEKAPPDDSGKTVDTPFGPG